MGSTAVIRAELEQVLQRLAEQRGAAYAATIADLVWNNLDRGRVEPFVNQDARSPAAAYVDLVVAEYDSQHEYVREVQVVQSTRVWKPLFEKLQKWAFNLIRSRLQSNPHGERMEHAVNCAADAGAAIASSYFPYDTAFEGWMYVLLKYTVNKYVHGLPGFGQNDQLPHVPLDKWTEWYGNLVDPRAERALRRYELAQLLSQAIGKLPPGQQEVIDLLFGPQGYSYSEIAEETGRSCSALYKAKYDALDRLRTLLGEVEYRLP